MGYSKMVRDWLAQYDHEKVMREFVLKEGFRMHELAFVYPSQSRQSESFYPKTLGFIDYRNAAVIREMTWNPDD